MRLSRVSVGESRDPTIRDGDGWARCRCDRNVKCDKKASEKLRGVVPRLRAGPMDDVKLGEPISNKCSWKKPPSRWAPDESTTKCRTVVRVAEVHECQGTRSSTKLNQRRPERDPTGSRVAPMRNRHESCTARVGDRDTRGETS